MNDETEKSTLQEHIDNEVAIEQPKKSGFDMMSLKPDEQMAEEGVWVEFYDGAELKVAQAGNKKYKAYISQELKKHRRKIEREDKNADKLADEITLVATAKFLLLDWKNVDIDGEVDVKYNPELGAKVMRQVDILRKEVESQSGRLENFQKQDNEDDLENVKDISPGS